MAHHEPEAAGQLQKLLRRLNWKRRTKAKKEAAAPPAKMVDMALLGRKEVMRGGVWFNLEFASYISTDKPSSLGFHFGYGIKIYVPKNELPAQFMAQLK